MLLDDLLDLLLLKVLKLILFEVETKFGTTTKRGVDSIKSDGESTTGSRLPDVLFVIVVFRDDLNALSYEVGGVETDTELSNHRNVSARAERLHESLEIKICS